MAIIGGLVKLVLGVVGLVLLTFGLMCLGFFVAVLISPEGLAGLPLGQVWFQNDPFFALMDTHSIQLAQVVIERKLGLVSLWNPGVTTLLNWPSWQALLVVGVVASVLGYLLLRPLFGRRR